MTFASRRRAGGGREGGYSRAVRSPRNISLTAAVVLLLGLLTVAGRGLADMHDDIAAQRGLITTQLQTTRAQLEVARAQLRVAEDSRDAAQAAVRRAASLEAVAVQTRDLGARAAGDVEQLRAMTEQVLVLSREIARLAAETERHAESLDRKTGPSAP